MMKDELASIVGEEGVDDGEERLVEYSMDPDCTIKRRPSLVVMPRATEEVKDIVKWANKTSTPIIPVSSGHPHHRGDTIPGMGGVMVDLGRMNGIRRIDRRNRVALIEPGVTFGRIQPELKKEGLRLIPPLSPRATKSVIGSVLEREPTLAPRLHWDISDPMCCMEVVFGNGEVFWTGEAAGPGDLKTQWEMGGAQKFPLGPHQVDYHRIVQGSQGTIGIVTWASIKCELYPSIRKTIFIPSEDISPLIDLAYDIIRRDLGDEVLFLDRTNLKALLGNKANEFNKWTLIVGINGYEYFPEERVDYQVEDTRRLADERGLSILDELPGVSSDRILQVMEGTDGDTVPRRYTFKGGLLELFFLTTMDRVKDFLDIMSIHKEKHLNDGVETGIYIQPLVQGTSCHLEFDCYYSPHKEGEEESVRLWMEKAVPRLLDNGAFFSRPYPDWAQAVYSRYDRYATSLRKVKGIFDPNNIMNPGKLCF